MMETPKFTALLHLLPTEKNYMLRSLRGAEWANGVMSGIREVIRNRSLTTEASVAGCKLPFRCRRDELVSVFCDDERFICITQCEVLLTQCAYCFFFFFFLDFGLALDGRGIIGFFGTEQNVVRWDICHLVIVIWRKLDLQLGTISGI